MIVTDHVHEEGERHEDSDLQSHLNKDQLEVGLNVKLTRVYTHVRQAIYPIYPRGTC